jgi:hypothetical protein
MCVELHQERVTGAGEVETRRPYLLSILDAAEKHYVSFMV